MYKTGIPILFGQIIMLLVLVADRMTCMRFLRCLVCVHAIYNKIIAINKKLLLLYNIMVQELWTRCTLLILRCGLGGCWSHPENHSCVPTSLKSLRQSYYYHLAFDTRIFQNLTVEMCTFNFPKFSQIIIINKIISWQC